MKEAGFIQHVMIQDALLEKTNSSFSCKMKFQLKF